MGGEWLKHQAKLLLLSVLVGVAAGVAAILFYWGLNTTLDWVFDLTKYHPPQPGESGAKLFVGEGRRWWLLLFLPAIGGLGVGLIVNYLAREVEGGGTEAAIDAFHNTGARIRARVILLKALAAAFTIGGGGSAGREGPIAHIGSAIGSNIAKLFRLDSKQRRLLLIAGFAGGIAATFRAPLGGAIYAVEVLYREDFESDGIISSIISAVMAYVVFTMVLGHGELFTTPHFEPISAHELLGYAILVVITTLAGIAHIKLYFFVRNRFEALQIPRWVKPAIGGLGVGIIGLLVPQVMFIGYGFLQQAINGGELLRLGKTPEFAIWALFAIAAAKMAATALTVGSGGAGGLFAPSMVIGGLIGAGVGMLLHKISPSLVPSPSAYVLVGMGSFFAGIAKVPLASLIMVSEMSGNYSLLAPMMLVGITVYLFNRKLTIYEEQTPTRLESPAHRHELLEDVLHSIKVSKAYRSIDNLPAVSEAAQFNEVVHALTEADLPALPVVNTNDEVVGVVSLDYVRGVIFETGLDLLLIAKDVAQKAEFVTPEDTLNKAMKLFLKTSAPAIFVVPTQNTRRRRDIIGMLTHAQLIASYNRELEHWRGQAAGETE